jgi:hypothetical protein
LTLGTGFSTPVVNGNGGTIKLYTQADGFVRIRFYGSLDRYASGINVPSLGEVKISSAY